MATGNMTLDATPMQPPGVAGQMGAGSESGGLNIAEMVRNQAAGGPPKDFASAAQAHPQGALITRIEAIEKVLRETARDNPPMAMYANRAIEILKTGMAETIKMQKPGVVPAQPPEKGSVAPPTGEGAKGFVG